MFTKGKVFISLVTTVAINASVVFAGTNGGAVSSIQTSQDIPVNHQIVHTNEVPRQVADTVTSAPQINRDLVAARKPLGNSDKPVYTTVQEGQNLWSISREYGTSVTNLERWNGLSNGSTLHIGQRLIVGWGSTDSHTTVSSRDGSVDSNVAAATQGLEVVQYAEQFLGAPYVWGGDSPSGFDCSGFVMYAFRHFGIQLPHTSFGQFEQGVNVSRDDLAPGDLVFFSTAGTGASHVGIYAGDSKFINAASGSIRFSSLSESYWASSYVGARRIIN